MTEKEQEDLSAYLDDALTPAEKARVEEALAGSAELRRTLAQLRRLRGALKEMSPIPLPAGFAEEVRRRARPKPRRVWLLAPTFVVAAAAVLVMVRITDEEKAMDAVIQDQIPAAREMKRSTDRPANVEGPRAPAVGGRGDAARMSTGRAALDDLDKSSLAQGSLRVEGIGKDDSLEGALKEETLALEGNSIVAPARSEAAGLGVAAKRKTMAADVYQEWAGQHRGFAEGRQVVVRSWEEWDKLWQEIHAFRTPAPATPPMEFRQQMVVGVLLDEKGSGGHAVRVTRTALSNGELRVYYHAAGPAAGTTQTTVMTQPYHLRAVARHNGDVRFIKE